jgi:peptidase A4-like protein
LETRALPSTLVSTNWSGYAAFASPANFAVTAVSGSWTVPTVASTTNLGWSSSWVGIDGFNSNTVEQIGTEQDTTATASTYGTPQYYAWYEMYPKGLVRITTMTISPGDQMNASVTYASGKFTLSITDTTKDQSFSITLSQKRAKRSSAEWVEEAPSSFFGVLPLAPFGTVQFSNAHATLNGITGPIDGASWQNASIDMVNSSGTLLDTTSSLTDSTDSSGTTSSFSITATFSNSTLNGTGGGHHRNSTAVITSGQFLIPDAPAQVLQPNTTIASVAHATAQVYVPAYNSPTPQPVAFVSYLLVAAPATETTDDVQKQDDAQGDGMNRPPDDLAGVSRLVDTPVGTMSCRALDDFFADPAVSEQNHFEEAPALVGSNAPAIDVVAGAELSALLLGAYLGNPIKAKETEDNTKRKVKWL